MRFCDFINPLYSNLPCASKDRFALEIFSALCGETDPKGKNKEEPFSAALPEGLTGGDGTYRKRLFNGNHNKYKGLSSRIKEHILEHNNKVTFLKYCGESVAEGGLTRLCVAYGIISTASKGAVFATIFEQFLEFARSTDDNATNIMPKTAYNYREETTDSLPPPKPTTPLYPGDDYIATECKPMTAMHYQRINAFWVITNKGNVTWQGRYLEVVSDQTRGVRALSPKIDIPTLRPKDYTKIVVEYDARHFDGDWEIVWEVKDSSRRICFPNKNGLRQTVAVSARKPSE
jgi:hypothetical protein